MEKQSEAAKVSHGRIKKNKVTNMHVWPGPFFPKDADVGTGDFFSFW